MRQQAKKGERKPGRKQVGHSRQDDGELKSLESKPCGRRVAAMSGMLKSAGYHLEEFRRQLVDHEREEHRNHLLSVLEYLQLRGLQVVEKPRSFLEEVQVLSKAWDRGHPSPKRKTLADVRREQQKRSELASQYAEWALQQS